MSPLAAAEPVATVTQITVSRVIHSSRGVGFTGWIGVSVVFDRALSADAIKTLRTLSKP